MPVLVTGLETAAGRAAVTALLRAGGEVRVFADPGQVDEAEFERVRAGGCKVALGELDDEGRLESAAERAHTVVHLAGGPLSDPATELEVAATVVSAALGAGCRRLVWASHLGADAPAGHPYLLACAEIEALLAESPLETIVLRRALTYGPGDALTLALTRGGAPAAAAAARHRPLYAEDLGAAVAAADRQRGSTQDLHLVVSLAGPDEMRLDEFAHRLAGGRVDPGAGLPEAVIDLLARDLTGGPDTLGSDGTPVATAIPLVRSTVSPGGNGGS